MCTTNAEPTSEEPPGNDAVDELSIMDGEVFDDFCVIANAESDLPVIWTWSVVMCIFLDYGMHTVCLNPRNKSTCAHVFSAENVSDKIKYQSTA
jgi:hypothetical protein